MIMIAAGERYRGRNPLGAAPSQPSNDLLSFPKSLP
jgi:hypothetical protein